MDAEKSNLSSPDPEMARQNNLLEMLFEGMPMGIAIIECAQHGRWLEGERPLRRLVAPTVS
jgi:hypothetical protein